MITYLVAGFNYVSCLGWGGVGGLVRYLGWGGGPSKLSGVGWGTGKLSGVGDWLSWVGDWQVIWGGGLVSYLGWGDW